MTTTAVYIQGATLPDLLIDWEYSDGTDAGEDFEDDYDLRVLVGKPGQAAVLEKTEGVSADVAGVHVAWDLDGEITDLEPGVWTVQGEATRTSDGKNRRGQILLRIKRAVLETGS